MAIPNYQEAMLPLLRFCASGEERSFAEATDAIAAEFGATQAEREELLPSGKQTVIRNRVGWARTYLAKARLIERTRRGYFKLTPRGRDVLASPPPRIDTAYLNRFPEFVEFRAGSGAGGDGRGDAPSPSSVPGDADEGTPDDRLRDAVQEIRRTLRAELLDQVKSMTPAFFERLVIDLLVGLGYGGTVADAGQAVGRSGDGGIDGVIKEDRLGLDAIYVQAKMWDASSVGRPEIQKFVGALHGQRARKGVFITTSRF